MIRKVTSVIVTNDALGERVTAVYSVIDEETGKILEADKRLEKVAMEKSPVGEKLFKYAQAFIDKDLEASSPKEEKEEIIIDGREPAEK